MAQTASYCRLRFPFSIHLSFLEQLVAAVAVAAAGVVVLFLSQVGLRCNLTRVCVCVLCVCRTGFHEVEEHSSSLPLQCQASQSRLSAPCVQNPAGEMTRKGNRRLLSLVQLLCKFGASFFSQLSETHRILDSQWTLESI